MDIHQVYELLEQNKNPNGIEYWQTISKTGGLSSYGIGLTVQRKLAKRLVEIGNLPNSYGYRTITMRKCWDY